MKLFLIEHSQLMREALARIFSQNNIHLIGEAMTITAAVDALDLGGSEIPDIVLVDLSDLKDDPEALTRLSARLPGARKIAMTRAASIDVLRTCLSNGMDGYLTGEMSSEALVQSIQLIALGEKIMPTSLVMLLASGEGRAPSPVAAPSGPTAQGLSTREIQILRALMNGRSNKAIARELNITEATVKVHLKGVLRKVNAANRTQAAIWALNNGYGDTPLAPPREAHAQAPVTPLL